MYQFNPARPGGQCSAALLPGTTDGIASAPDGGYWVLARDGEVAACDAPAYGSYDDTVSTVASSEATGPPIGVGSVGADGFWLMSQAGQVIPFGSARFFGQDNTAARLLGQPVPTPTFTTLAPTPSGNGYWLLTAYGHVMPYHAPYYSSADFAGATTPTSRRFGEVNLTPRAAIGIAPTDGGKGYVIVTEDGATARFGRGPNCPLPAGVTVAGIAPDYRTGGYWVAATTGRVYACQAPTYPYKAVRGAVAGIAALPDGNGYRLATTAGTVWDFGAATFHGNPN